MKKIAFITNNLSYGGAERVAVRLAEYLSKNQYNVTIITFWKENQEYSLSSDVKRISLSDNKKNKLEHFIKLRTCMKYGRFDLVIVMEVRNCLCALPACWGLNTRIIVSERNAPEMYAGNKIVIKLSRRFMRRAEGFVFQTREAKSFYDKTLKNRGVVISNPLDTESLPELYKGERRKTIVTAGRMVEQKNQEMLIEAFEMLTRTMSEYTLEIYGNGPLESELRKKAINLKIQDKVIFKGNSKKLLEEIKDAAVFVLSSNYEGMPNVLMEAMAMGIPCVATDCVCGGPHALINNMQNGILIPVGDKDALRDALLFLLNNKEESGRIGKNAVEIRKKLDIKVIGVQWKNYINEIISLNGEINEN